MLGFKTSFMHIKLTIRKHSFAMNLLKWLGSVTGRNQPPFFGTRKNRRQKPRWGGRHRSYGSFSKVFCISWPLILCFSTQLPFSKCVFATGFRGKIYLKTANYIYHKWVSCSFTIDPGKKVVSLQVCSLAGPAVVLLGPLVSKIRVLILFWHCTSLTLSRSAPKWPFRLGSGIAISVIREVVWNVAQNLSI